MKNVKDAVNHFGRWTYLGAANWIVFKQIGTFEWWSFWDDTELSETWQRVCTKEEFENDLLRTKNERIPKQVP